VEWDVQQQLLKVDLEMKMGSAIALLKMSTAFAVDMP